MVVTCAALAASMQAATAPTAFVVEPSPCPELVTIRASGHTVRAHGVQFQRLRVTGVDGLEWEGGSFGWRASAVPPHGTTNLHVRSSRNVRFRDIESVGGFKGLGVHESDEIHFERVEVRKVAEGVNVSDSGRVTFDRLAVSEMDWSAWPAHHPDALQYWCHNAAWDGRGRIEVRNSALHSDGQGSGTFGTRCRFAEVLYENNDLSVRSWPFTTVMIGATDRLVFRNNRLASRHAPGERAWRPRVIVLASVSEVEACGNSYAQTGADQPGTEPCRPVEPEPDVTLTVRPGIKVRVLEKEP